MAEERQRDESGQYAGTLSEERVLEAVGDAKRVATTSEVAEAVGKSIDTARRWLNDLHEQGRIGKKKVGARGVVWWVEYKQSSEPIEVPDHDELPGPNAPIGELETAIGDVVGARAHVENRRQRMVRVLNKYNEHERVCEFCQQEVDRDVLEAIREDQEERIEELEQHIERLETIVEDRED